MPLSHSQCLSFGWLSSLESILPCTLSSEHYHLTTDYLRFPAPVPGIEFASPSTVRRLRRPDTVPTGACLPFLPQFWFVCLKSIRLVDCCRLVSLTGVRANNMLCNWGIGSLLVVHSRRPQFGESANDCLVAVNAPVGGCIVCPSVYGSISRPGVINVQGSSSLGRLPRHQLT